MDGNGRLSRLLAHHSLNLQQALPLVVGQATLLPLSVAMKRHEADYLTALKAFSRPARQLWGVTDLADNDFLFDFKSTPCACAHWNGETAARFVTTCAEQALAQSLSEETQLIQVDDRALDRIDRAFNLPNRTVNLLIQWIRQNGGQMPARRRNAPELVGLQPAQSDHIAAIVAACFNAPEQVRPSRDEQANEDCGMLVVDFTGGVPKRDLALAQCKQRRRQPRSMRVHATAACAERAAVPPTSTHPGSPHATPLLDCGPLPRLPTGGGGPLKGAVYSPSPGIVCDKKGQFCADEQGTSLAHTEEYLGQKAENTMIGHLRSHVVRLQQRRRLQDQGEGLPGVQAQ